MRVLETGGGRAGSGFQRHSLYHRDTASTLPATACSFCPGWIRQWTSRCSMNAWIGVMEDSSQLMGILHGFLWSGGGIWPHYCSRDHGIADGTGISTTMSWQVAYH